MVDLDPARVSEANKRRPAVIVSNDGANTTAVRLNRGGLADALATSAYSASAIVPAFTWIDGAPPGAPSVSVEPRVSAMHVKWAPSGQEAARWWLVQWRTSTAWNATMVWGTQSSLDITFTGNADRADVVAVTALDAVMNASPAAVWRATR